MLAMPQLTNVRRLRSPAARPTEAMSELELEDAGEQRVSPGTVLSERVEAGQHRLACCMRRNERYPVPCFQCLRTQLSQSPRRRNRAWSACASPQSTAWHWGSCDNARREVAE